MMPNILARILRRPGRPGRTFLLVLGLSLFAALPFAVVSCRDGATKSASAEVWYCPMHPSVVQDHAGECPICHMKLVLRQTEQSAPTASAPGKPPVDYSMVEIDPARTQLIGLVSEKAARRPIGGEIRTTGRVAADETRIHHVHTKYDAWVDDLYADFTGKWVREGEPLVDLYSPELLEAQEEYLVALRTRDRLAKPGTSGSLGTAGDDLVASARRRLELLDVGDKEIDEIEKRRKVVRAVTLYSPMSGYVLSKVAVHGMKSTPMDSLFDIADLSVVWVVADVYESELPRVRVGQEARMTLSYLPGREWKGRVTWIEPFVDPKTRTVKVRMEFSNPRGQLKPEMYASVVLSAPTREALTIPEDAVVDGGLRTVVFVDHGNGRIEPREVKLGLRGGGQAEVLSGLAEGEAVTTRANFLLDSESRLKAALEAIAPGATGTAAAPPHGSHAP